MVRTKSNPLEQMEVPHGTKVVSHVLSVAGPLRCTVAVTASIADCMGIESASVGMT